MLCIVQSGVSVYIHIGLHTEVGTTVIKLKMYCWIRFSFCKAGHRTERCEMAVVFFVVFFKSNPPISMAQVSKGLHFSFTPPVYPPVDHIRGWALSRIWQGCATGSRSRLGTLKTEAFTSCGKELTERICSWSGYEAGGGFPIVSRLSFLVIYQTMFIQF